MDINGVFDRICKKEGLKSDAALADFLGVSKSAIHQSRTKGTANLWTVLEKCQGYDLNWLFRGEASPSGSEGPISVDQAIKALYLAGHAVHLEPLGGAGPTVDV